MVPIYIGIPRIYEIKKIMFIPSHCGILLFTEHKFALDKIRNKETEVTSILRLLD